MSDENSTLLKLEEVSCKFKDHTIFSNVNLTVNKGDVIAIVGRSGGGKTTLLKCIVHMTMYDGRIYLWGKKPTDYGVPNYRKRVLYVPQRPSMLPSTPRNFIRQIHSYGSRAGDSCADAERAAIELGTAWSLDEEVWDRSWASCSGGEAQRAALAVACTLQGTEILLLDEPTSALDAATMKTVETHLASLPGSSGSSIQAILWITHSDDQTKLASRLIKIAGTVEEQQVPGDV